MAFTAKYASVRLVIQKQRCDRPLKPFGAIAIAAG